jgi:long-chain acyl-CoA synthetase
MTETNAITVSISGKAYLDRPGSCGQPNHMWDLRILDDDGNVMPPETPGLLQCRGVGLMKEYWNNHQATLDNIDNDGWLDTGDIARIDEEGYLYIMDRAKDLIIRGGENISCAEVESAVYDHPSVKEATSFGMKEERLGEEVAVAITPKDGETIEPAEFIAFVTGKLAKFKVPTRVFIWPGDLPRGAGTCGMISRKARPMAWWSSTLLRPSFEERTGQDSLSPAPACSLLGGPSVRPTGVAAASGERACVRVCLR